MQDWHLKQVPLRAWSCGLTLVTPVSPGEDSGGMQWGPGLPKTGLLVHLSQLLTKSDTVVPLLPWAQSNDVEG